MKRREFLASAGAAMAVGASELAHANPAVNPPIERNMRIAPTPTPVALALPNVTLRTQDNKKVRLYEDLLKGKIFSINMFYVACDGACPRVTANLSRVQPLIGARLGRDIFMYSITLQPELDTPERLREYMGHHEINHPGWTFLTGAHEDIELLRRGLGFWDPDPERDKLKTTHAGLAQLGNEPLDRWMACPTMAEPREIRRVLSYLDWPRGWPNKGVQKTS